MQMNIHLNFNGNAKEAFAYYQKVFATPEPFLMTYGDAPAGMPVPPGWGNKVMHTSIPLGAGLLMGCDAPPDRSRPMGGFQVSAQSKDEAEIKRIWAALSEGGSMEMPLVPTFWSPLFGMCTDKFGVAWMVGMPGEGQS
jgi:PhnB protein